MSCTTPSSSGLSQIVRKCWPATFTRCDYDLGPFRKLKQPEGRLPPKFARLSMSIEPGRSAREPLLCENPLKRFTAGRERAGRIVQSKYLQRPIVVRLDPLAPRPRVVRYGQNCCHAPALLMQIDFCAWR